MWPRSLGALATQAARPASDALEAAFQPMDEDAFQAIYRQTAAPLRNYVARVLGDVAQADDIVQEAYLRLLRRPPEVGDRQQVRAYLFRIASNLVVDQWRRRKADAPVAALPDRSAPSRDPVLRLDMSRIFRRLQPRERQLLWLAHVEGATHREIAAALSLGERSIRVLLSRARRKLARLVRESGHGRGDVS
jgi:RNA polymerase sigma-70 factor (ECF subfamily)